MDAREGNDRLAERAEHLQFVSRVPMMCECSDPGCRTLVMISLSAYREVRRDPGNFMTAPGHGVEGAELQREEADYTILRAHPEKGDESDDRRSA
jgi:hypothetical protein